ncbi:hypothetical protein [Chondromyces apiculatus]|nr:hypothetical protein [Chondromyces apiculatus]
MHDRWPDRPVVVIHRLVKESRRDIVGARPLQGQRRGILGC